MDKTYFKSEAYRQLIDVFNKTLAKQPDMEAKARTQGFIYAGQFMQIITHDEARALIEKAHIEVFGVISAERKTITAKQKLAFETHDYEYFEIPTIERMTGKKISFD